MKKESTNRNPAKEVLQKYSKKNNPESLAGN
jgi:hypothetical protein